MSTDRAPARGGLRRRQVVAGLAASAPTFASRSAPRLPEMPAGACDAHVHVVGDPRRFPMAPDRDYTPPPATPEALDRMLREAHLDRVVIVAAAVHDDSNETLVDAIRQLGQIRARGIAWLPRTPTDAAFEQLREAGVVGFRVLLDTSGAVAETEQRAKFQGLYEIATRWGWHLDIATPPDMIASCLPTLATAPVPLVLDTYAWLQGGLDQPGADAILALVRSGAAYVKLSEPYRLSTAAPDYPELAPVVAALIEANPDRVLWGSGWPYLAGPDAGYKVTEITPNLPVDVGALLARFAAWVPDPGLRRRILVDNPARLYGFGVA